MLYIIGGLKEYYLVGLKKKLVKMIGAPINNFFTNEDGHWHGNFRPDVNIYLSGTWDCAGNITIYSCTVDNKKVPLTIVISILKNRKMKNELCG